MTVTPKENASATELTVRHSQRKQLAGRKLRPESTGITWTAGSNPADGHQESVISGDNSMTARKDGQLITIKGAR